MSIFDNIKIKIRCRGFDENPVAIATLNLNGEAEVRFIPIFWKRNKTQIFLTMPSIKAFGYGNCFVILDGVNTYPKIQKQILQKFLEIAEEKYCIEEFGQIKKAVEQPNEDINPDDLPI